MDVLKILAKETNAKKLPYLLPEIVDHVRQSFSFLKNRAVPFEGLVVSQTLSRELDEYSISTPLWCAAKQLQVQGKKVRRDWQIRYIYTARGPGVHAWDLPTKFDPHGIDTLKYKDLAFRVSYEVLQPLGVRERVLKD